MKTFYAVESRVNEGIPVKTEPYPHVCLGEGGNKRSTRISIGKRDAEQIIIREGGNVEGEPSGERPAGTIRDVGVIALKDRTSGEPTGQYLIVAPRGGKDDRVLVLWSVPSGYRGSADIKPDKRVKVIVQDKAWHSQKGNLGENDEILAILEPGQGLNVKRSGRNIEETELRLEFSGKEVKISSRSDDTQDDGYEHNDYV